MATYGYKIFEDDTFQSVLSDYQEEREKGTSPSEIEKVIRRQSTDAVDRHIVLFALAYAEKQFGVLSSDVQAEVISLIDGGVDRRFYEDLEADADFLSHRDREVQKFRRALLSEEPLRPILRKIGGAALKKGDCFWYRSKGSVYGAIVMEVNGTEDNFLYYLILLSERLPGVPAIEDVLSSVSYTAAWFAPEDLLPQKRMHFLGKAPVVNDYHNTLGLRDTPSGFYLRNYGDKKTWNHEESLLYFHEETVREILAPTRKFLPT